MQNLLIPAPNSGYNVITRNTVDISVRWELANGRLKNYTQHQTMCSPRQVESRIEIGTALLDATSKEIERQSKLQGRYNEPLHITCGFQPLEMLTLTWKKFLLKSQPLSTNAIERALDSFCFNWRSHAMVAALTEFYDDGVGLEVSVRDTNHKYSLDRYWPTICFLSIVVYYGSTACSENGYRQYMLHACTALVCTGCVPDEVFRIALYLYPEQLLMPDIAGNLPLHIASIADQFYTLEIQKEKTSLIDILVEACPEAALISNNDNDAALHLAAWSGKPWIAGVKTIFNASPYMNAVNNNSSLLSPFMNAVSGNAPLDVIYILFRESPQFANYAIVVPPLGDDNKEKPSCHDQTEMATTASLSYFETWRNSNFGTKKK